MRTQKDTELTPSHHLRWSSAKKIRELYGLSHPAVKKLADTGVIRRKKMGEAIQSAALYHIGDLDEFMEQDCLSGVTEGTPAECSDEVA